VEWSVIDERIVTPRSIAIKDREWILQISRRPSFVAVRAGETEVAGAVEVTKRLAPWRW
jgi:hypothetical protein